LIFAGDGGIVEGFGGAVTFGSFEEQAMFDAVGDTSEASFAVSVGADFEVELAQVHESVGDVHFDFGGVDGSPGGVGDREVRRAGSDCAVDDRD